MKILRFGLLFKILSALMLLSAVMVYIVNSMSKRIEALDSSFETLLSTEEVAVTANARANGANIYLALLLHEVEDAKTERQAAALDKEFVDTEKLFREMMDKLKQAQPEHAALAGAFEADFMIMLAAKKGIVEKALLGDSEGAGKLTAEVVGRSVKLRERMRSLTETIEATIAAKRQQLRDSVDEAVSSAYTEAASAGILAFLVSFALVQFGIIRPLKQLMHVMTPLSRGDYSVSVPGLGKNDEIGDVARTIERFKQNGIEAERAKLAAIQQERSLVNESIGDGLRRLARKELAFRISAALPQEYARLRDDFNRAMGQLQDTIEIVSGTVLTINSGTQEISSASRDLARRTESQAASIEETSAAMAEITNTVKKTADGAANARKMMSETEQDAASSREVVRSAMQAMRSIETSSARITQIISVIDEIAFQTNLLALNAGVEAARAGDAGRGFAVVASEVRALAQRSADAAREIKDLISTSKTEVERGARLVDETGEKLFAIIENIAAVSKTMQEIAGSAEAQAATLHEINTAVGQMDQSTQQNAAMVEQADAATRNLADQSDNLRAMVADFDIRKPPATQLARGLQAA